MGVLLIQGATNSLKSWPDSLRYSFYFHIFLLLPLTWLRHSGQPTLATRRSPFLRSCLLSATKLFQNLAACPNQTTPEIGSEYKPAHPLCLDQDQELFKVETGKKSYQWLIVHALHVTMIPLVAARVHNEPAVHVALGSQRQVLGGTLLLVFKVLSSHPYHAGIAM